MIYKRVLEYPENVSLSSIAYSNSKHLYTSIMSSAYVLTGGTGNTSLKLASQLHDAGHKAIVASTKGPEGVPAPFTGVKFDWTDESTYSNALPVDSNIKAVYLLTPALSVSIDNVKAFIALARKSNVNRFVSLTAAKPFPHMKQIEAHLKELGDKEGVEWAILRPSWFYGEEYLLKTVSLQIPDL